MKRAFDLFLSLIVLVIFAVPAAVISLAIMIFLGRPVIFAQDRPGVRGKIFKMYKFRSMTTARDEEGNLLPDSQRLNSFGRLLRKTSLDELPEIFNVLKGDMSFVGPRPLLVEYLKKYTPHQRRRHEVLPGITGWAQVNGRNAISWDQRFELDIWYVENQSFFLDLKIIFLTVWTVLRREGVTSKSSVTMERFDAEPIDSNKDKNQT